MTMKDIQVLVDNDAQCESRIRLAHDLAGHFDACLTGVYVQHQLGIPNYARVEVPDDVLAIAAGKLEEMAGSARECYLSVVDDAKHRFVHEDGPLELHLIAQVRCADLVVLPQKDRDDDSVNPLYDPAPLLLSMGRPALIIPKVGNYTAPAKRALVAWDGSRAATRALHDALPLLSAATQTVVASIGDSDPNGLQRVAEHLERHGITAETRHQVRDDMSIDNVLLSMAADLGSELLVMGGYGHSRLRETVLGGATRGILKQMTLPVLMSH